MNKVLVIIPLLVNAALYAYEPEPSKSTPPVSPVRTEEYDRLNNILSRIQRGPSRAGCFPSVEKLREKFYADWYPKYSKKLREHLWSHPKPLEPVIHPFITGIDGNFIPNDKVYQFLAPSIRYVAWDYFNENLWDDFSNDIFSFIKDYALCSIRDNMNNCLASRGFNEFGENICRLELQENYLATSHTQLASFIIDSEIRMTFERMFHKYSD